MEKDILISPEQIAQTQQRFIVKVYGWMAFALAITGLVAMFTANSPELIKVIVGNKIVFYGIMIAEVLLVISLVGQILDVLIFHRIKKMTGEKNIWLRATGSTLVSQLVDSFVVLFIAFYLGRQIQSGQGEPWTLHQIAVTGTGNYIYKFVMAILLTPVIYLVHVWIEKYLGDDLATKMKSAAMMK